MNYIIRGELQDERIIASIYAAKQEYENGEIIEARDRLMEIVTWHWIDNHNGTISCSYCHTWFYKDDRYSYMRYCPSCGARMVEPQESEE